MSPETPPRDPEGGKDAAPALPPPEARRSHRSFLVGLAAGAAGVALVGAAGLLLTGAPRPDPALQALAGRLDAVERRAPPAAVDLGPLTARLAALEQRPTPPPAGLAEATRALEALRGGLAALAARLDTAEAALAARAAAPPPPPPPDLSPLRAEIAAAVQRLQAAEDAVRSVQPMLAALTAEDRRLAQELARLQDGAALDRGREARRADRLLLAVFTLRDAVRRETPFAAELKALETVAAGDPVVGAALPPLAALAESGAPSLAALRQGFAPVARAMVVAERGQAGSGWLDQMSARLSTVVTVRRTGAEVEGDGAEAVAARAEALLAAGDLAGAVRLLEAAPAGAAAPAAAWLASAKARLALDAALAALTATALDLARTP